MISDTILFYADSFTEGMNTGFINDYGELMMTKNRAFKSQIPSVSRLKFLRTIRKKQIEHPSNGGEFLTI